MADEDKCPRCGEEYEVKLTPKMTEWYHRQTCSALTQEAKAELKEKDEKELLKWMKSNDAKISRTT
jgi:hypothetical protein